MGRGASAHRLTPAAPFRVSLRVSPGAGKESLRACNGAVARWIQVTAQRTGSS